MTLWKRIKVTGKTLVLRKYARVDAKANTNANDDPGKREEKMDRPLLTGLRNLREDLLRQLLLSSGEEKTEILMKIMEMEELIEDEEKAVSTARPGG